MIGQFLGYFNLIGQFWSALISLDSFSTNQPADKQSSNFRSQHSVLEGLRIIYIFWNLTFDLTQTNKQTHFSFLLYDPSFSRGNNVCIHRRLNTFVKKVVNIQIIYHSTIRIEFVSKQIRLERFNKSGHVCRKARFVSFRIFVLFRNIICLR